MYGFGVWVGGIYLPGATDLSDVLYASDRDVVTVSWSARCVRVDGEDIFLDQ